MPKNLLLVGVIIQYLHVDNGTWRRYQVPAAGNLRRNAGSYSVVYGRVTDALRRFASVRTPLAGIG